MDTVSPVWDRDAAARIIDCHRDLPGALLPLLHALQDRFRHVPSEAIPMLAQSLRLTQAEVYGVISFYHHFRRTPPGHAVIEVCRAEACQAQGCRSLEQHVKAQLGIDFHQTTADGAFTLEAVYCLGNCARGPAVRVGDQVYGDVTPQRFDEIAEAHGPLPKEQVA